jgi:hypothetical protein
MMYNVLGCAAQRISVGTHRASLQMILYIYYSRIGYYKFSIFLLTLGSLVADICEMQ